MSKKETYTTSYHTTYGKPILPIKRIQLFSPDEWEEFIQEWLEIKSEEYIEVDRLGGAGDKGRDVIAYITNKKKPNYKWDCYQCKHYDKPLTPSQVYVEFGKIIYYTYIKDYPVPDNYYFVAPRNCGTSLSMLLDSEDELKKNIKNNWDKYIKEGITSTKSIELKKDLLKYFEEFDFSIFSKISPLRVIEDHKTHSNHITRFGASLPEREKLDEKEVPSTIQKEETVYVNQLIEAYNTVDDTSHKSVNDLNEIHKKHFSRARINFHHAEQLRNFSRDSLPINTFEDFQNEILDSVIDKSEEEYKNSFIKVKEVESEARKVNIASNPLKDVMRTNDKAGVCHQLVNDKKIKWVEDDE
ncbi:ABC-three component system protein [uncultured Tenacibaculum sp.]|uniref:ABC-three component system protein n=1 Tax=uncultured Tenacibaculum sp. TaxID=174713 RepID=UPI002621138D|nr:ABC-three component system protein [uncultured Tenacibaculum sp.]